MDAVTIWLIVLVVLPFFLFLCRIILMAWKSVIISRRIKYLSNHLDAQRQAQVSTISGSVNTNGSNSPDTTSTGPSAADEHVKVDMPPTYDEVMKVFLDAKEVAAAAATADANATTSNEARTCRSARIDIEDPPPPHYSSI